MEIINIIEKNKKAIILVALVKQAENQVSIRGTGFIISKDGKFITNAHVYKELPENEKQHLMVKIMDKDDAKGIFHYKNYKAELLKIDDENDIAFMQIINEEKIEFEVISDFENSESLKEGNEAIFMGYPLATEFLSMGFGITMISNSCIISSVKRRSTDGSLHFFMIDSHVNNGSSGSPIFSMETGKVIGIVSGKISQRIPMPDGKIIDVPSNIGICRPAKYIKEIINK